MANFDNSAQMAIDITFKFIKERMKEKGVAQYKLAEIIGVSEVTLIRNFKKETEMSLSTYMKICGALELRPYLIPAEIDGEMPSRLHFN